MPDDLRDALDDADPEETQASEVANSNLLKCSGCISPPGPGAKLRYRGRCRTARYYSRWSAQADWAGTQALVREHEKDSRRGISRARSAGGSEERLPPNSGI